MLCIGHYIRIYYLKFLPLASPNQLPLISLPHQFYTIPSDQKYPAWDVMFPDVFDGRGLPFLAEGRLVDLALDLMIILEVPSA